VKHLQDLEKPVHSVVGVSTNASWKTANLAERMGCMGLLEMPFNPLQVIGLLQKV
jgi:DNA-binding NtrC family response regulator